MQVGTLFPGLNSGLSNAATSLVPAIAASTIGEGGVGGGTGDSLVDNFVDNLAGMIAQASLGK